MDIRLERIGLMDKPGLKLRPETEAEYCQLKEIFSELQHHKIMHDQAESITGWHIGYLHIEVIKKET